MLAICFVWSLVLPVPVQAAVASAQAQQTAQRQRAQLTRLLLAARMVRPIHLPTPPPAIFPAVLRSRTPLGTETQAPTLLDEVGALARPIPAADVASWKTELHTTRPAAPRAAALHLWLGEWTLAHDRHPRAARWQFLQAERSVRPHDPLYGRATYDAAIAHMYAGAYAEATYEFQRLLSPKTALTGYGRRPCALWLRHAAAAAGYHADRAAMDIPEPPALDPLCGAAALAAGLRALGLPAGRETVLAHCRVTGEGSALRDLVAAGPGLGAVVRPVVADDQGLTRLPLPVVAHVEHDHFIAVVAAGKAGVSYLCADCGAWPGGRVDLTWRQWHALEPDVYATVTRAGSAWDRTLAALPGGKVPDRGLLVAAVGRITGLAPSRLLPLLSRLHGHVFLPLQGVQGVQCGNTGHSLHPPPNRNSPHHGDPVNLTTGEENYSANPDLVVYNPHGPSVSWTRLYNSLRGSGQGFRGGDQTYECNDYGIGWSQGYNVSVYDPTGGGTGTKYVVLPDGSRYSFTADAVPAPGATVQCQVEAGAPLLVEWGCDASGNSYYTVTGADRTRMVTGTMDGTTGCSRLAQIVDRNGNAIIFHYGAVAQGSGWPLLSSITSGDGTTLLSVQRATDGTGNVVAVSDCYGRSVYYHCDNYPTLNVPLEWPQSYQELDRVSQIVPTGSGQCPDRCAYGYEYVSNLEGQEKVVFLHMIATISPTGATVPSVLTIDYDPNTDFVSDQVDANGVTSSYSAVDAAGNPVVVSNYEKVTVTGAQGVVQTSVSGYDNNMDATAVTDNIGAVVATSAYGDAQDPYAASSVTDGHGVTVSATHDAFGNVLTSTSARGTVTTYTYDYSQFALGELISVQEGTNLAAPKAPTTFHYYEPSGLLASVTAPAPGTVGGGATVTASYTYNGLGDVVSATGPGNDVAATITVSYNYGPTPAIGQPISVTTPAGTTTFAYDAQGRVLNETDASGNRTDCGDPANGDAGGYNIAGGPLVVVLPATGQQGTGRGYRLTSYLYPGGPATGSSLYDENGTLVRQVGTTYDPAGQTLASSGTTQSVGYQYDALDRLTAIMDGNRNTTHYAYNAAGYLASVAYPGASGTTGYDTVRYTHDAAGYLTSTVDGRGVEADYGYESATGALSTVQYPASAALNEQYTYDAYGRTTTVTDGSGTTVMGDATHPGYDDWGDTLLVTTHYTGLPVEAICYAYNPDGSRSTMGTPGGSFSYRHDAAGRLTGLTNPFGEASSWGYQANGWLAQQTLADGVRAVYAHDAQGELTRLTNQTTAVTPAVLSDFQILAQGGYDGAGDRLGVTATLPGAPVSFSGQTGYAYGVTGQLTGEQSQRGGSYTRAFGYDGGAATGAGDPTTFRGTSHSYNTDNQDTANTYDGAGNPTTYQGSSLSFDANDRATSLGNSLTCGYTGGGLRAWKQGSTGGRTYFLYDGAVPVCELDGSGSVTAVNTFGRAGLLSRHTASGSTFYAFDERGNVTQRLDGTGGPVSTDLYDAYGQRTSTVSQPDPFGFGGQGGCYTDAETGLVLMAHRYYDPAAGRFLNRDPSGYAGGLNLYAYAADNPISFSDPSGFNPQNDGGDGSEYGDGHQGLWPDRLKNWGNSYIPPGRSIPGLFNDPRDIARGLLGLPSNIEHLGSPSGQHFGDPADYGWGGVAQDALTATTVIMAGAGAAAGIGGDTATTSARWVMPEDGGGAQIGDYWYTEHALERMAPDTPQVRAELETRATGRAKAEGLSPGTPEWQAWWNKNGPSPRGIPPMVVEAEMANPGSTGVTVISSGNRIITVIPK